MAGSQNDLSLTRITVPRPLTACYELDGSELKYQPENFVIWDSNKPDSTTPVIVSYDSPTIVFHFFTSGYSSYGGVQCQLTSSSGAGLSASFFEPVDFKVRKAHKWCGEAEVAVKLKNFSELVEDADSTANQVPWGFQGVINFVVNVKRHSQVLHFEVPLELYAIQPILPENFKNYGIPLDLLRLMVKETKRDSLGKHGRIRSRADYVRWICYRCHESTGQSGDSIDLVNGPIHNYRYDIWSYSPRFVSSIAGSFRLDDWLRYREVNAPPEYINCFDCASIVLSVLSLAIPHTDLQWRYINPFGYLPAKGVSLIGWGIVNTTGGFGTNPGKKILAAEDENRDGFSLHSMASIGASPDSPALDACAGPADGSYSMTEYIREHIDTNTLTKEKRATIDNAKSEGYLAGFNAFSRIPGSWTVDMTHTKKMDPKIREKLDAVISKVPRFPDSEKSVNIKKLFLQLWTDVPAMIKACDGKAVDDKDEMPKFAETLDEIHHDAIEVSWELMKIKVIIDICKSHEIAEDIFTRHISRLSYHPWSVLQPAHGNAHIQTMIAGGGYHLMVSDQYFIRIDALDMKMCNPDEKVKRTAEIIHRYLNDPTYHVDTKEIEADRGAFNIVFVPKGLEKKVYPAVYNQNFTVTITAPFATKVQATSTTGAVLVKTPQGRHKEGNIWEFDCIGMRNGSDEIRFLAARHDTFEVRSSREGLKINVTTDVSVKASNEDKQEDSESDEGDD